MKNGIVDGLIDVSPADGAKFGMAKQHSCQYNKEPTNVLMIHFL